jgi:hypothetical protein
MKRTAVALMLVASLGGCMSVDNGPTMSGPVCSGNCGPGYGPPTIPGVQGAWGQSVPVAPPYNAPMNARMAHYMMNQSVPLSAVQLQALNQPAAGPSSGIVQASANVPQGGMPGMAVPPGGLLAPPNMPLAPGMMPPGMMAPGKGPMPPGGPMMAAAGPIPPPGAMPLGPPPRFAVARTQVRFVRPSGMKITWFTQGPDGKPSYAAAPLETPGRYNFLQAAIYRLKLSGIEGRPGLELYPTLEVVPTNPKTEAFLAHNAVPVEFTAEDFDQVAAGNYLVKVIYLPDPAYQELAATGIGEIISTRLEPGADPIKEALRRGSILLVIRMGNMDQEAPNTPPIDAPGPHGPPHGAPPMLPPSGLPSIAPGMGGPAHGPGMMIPYTGMPSPMGPGGPMMDPGGPMMGPGGPMMGPGGPMPYAFPPAGYPTGMPMPPMQPMPGMPPAGMQAPAPAAPPAPHGANLAPLPRPLESGPMRPVGGSGPLTPGQPLWAPGPLMPAPGPQLPAGSSQLPVPQTPAALGSQDLAAKR